MTTTYKIHPAIGVMRVGDSDDYYLAPETVGGLPLDPTSNQPTSSFRDNEGKLRKQAARFRVFAYEEGEQETELQVGAGGLTHIEWTVYLANKKAVWYQFEQLTGSGQQLPKPHELGLGGYEDKGYLGNNEKNPNGTNPNRPYNPLRNAPITDASQRQRLILDPGPRTIGGPSEPSSATFDLPSQTLSAEAQPFGIDRLGGVSLDTNGNLIVYGGSGNSGYVQLQTGNTDDYPDEPQITAYANNNGWFDDISDGPVTARLFFEGQDPIEVQVPAWVVCAPPKYAPQIINQVTMWDNMFDVFVREMNYRPDIFANGEFNTDYEVDVASEILPILQRPPLYKWVMDMPIKGVNEHAAVQGSAETNDPSAFPHYILRDINQYNTPGRMPKLCGDNPFGKFTKSRYLTLTATQYFLLTQWSEGKIATEPPTPLGPGEQLDKAYLENCVGGPFTPGIEITWISRNARIYAEPFRINQKGYVIQGSLSQTNGDDNQYGEGLEPGDLGKYMAQPWQADYNECTIQPVTDIGGTSPVNIWWWPAQRPWSVYPEAESYEQVPWTRGFVQDPDGSGPIPSDLQMVTNWKDLGFILQQGSGFQAKYLEVDRNTAAIEAYTDAQEGQGEIVVALEHAARPGGKREDL